MNTIDWLVNCLSAASAFVAAALWYKSSTTRIRCHPDRYAPIVRDDPKGQIDVFATIEDSTKWNRYGAVAASAAALFQGAAALIPR